MPFLTLNGWTIPIALGGEESNNTIGFPLARSHTGTPLTDARAYKREWRFSTIPLTEMAARAVIGMVQGRGFSFPFDSTDYSGNGLVPTGSVRTLRGLAADGAAVYDADGIAYGKFGAATTGGDVSVEGGATNVLNAIATNGPNICTGTDSLSTTGGFTAVLTGAISSDTTYSWQGSRSLKINPALSGDGVITAFATVNANATVTASVYVRVDATQSARLSIYQTNSASLLLQGSSTSITVGTWRRLELTATLTGGATTCAIQVTASNNGTGNVYCDGFQIEESSFATSWVAGTRAAGQLNYGTCLADFDDMTINAWVKMPAGNLSVNRIITLAGVEADEYLTLYRLASSASLVFELGDTPSAIYTGPVYNSAPWDGGWHMVTGVCRHYPETGENALTLYWDGASVGTPTTINAGYSGMKSTSALYIGHSTSAGNAVMHSGRIDAVQVLPYAAPADLVTAWYAQTAPVELPKLVMGGDVIPENSVTVIGEIKNVVFRPHQNGSAWRKNGRIVDFSLYEVSRP